MEMNPIYHMHEILADITLGDSLELAISNSTIKLEDKAYKQVTSFLSHPSAHALLELEQVLIVHSMQVCGELAALAICLAHHNHQWVRQAVHSVQHHTEGKTYRQMGQRSTKVRLLDGSYLKLTTPYLACQHKGPGRPKGVGRRGKAGGGCYPVLESLGIHNQATPGLLNEVAQSSSRLSSFEEVQVTLGERGCFLDVKTVRRLTLSVGQQALTQRNVRLKAAQEGKQESQEFSGKRVVIGTDGGRIRTRVENRGRRRQTGRRGYKTPWREPKLIVAYIVDENGHLDGEYTPLYDATLGNADDAFGLLLAELKLRGADEAIELCVVGDGARWIWNRIDELAKGLGLREEQVIRVADFYHVSERLCELSQIPKGWSAEERQQWYNKMYNLVWNGRIREVLRASRQLQKGRRGKAIGEHINYLENLREYMKYDVYREKGLPCGSGAIESAMRRVVNLRLKGPGLFWNEDNAEAMLPLRSYQKAGRWEELLMRVLNRTFDGKPRWEQSFQEQRLQNVA